MNDSRRPGMMVLVNSGPLTGLGERGRQIAAARGGASILFHAGSRIETARAFCGAVLRQRPETIYCIDNAVCAIVAAALGRLRWNCRVILDTGDAVGPLRRKLGGGYAGWIAGEFLERAGYRLADMVVTRSAGLAERVRRLSAKQVLVIPDGFDAGRIPAGDGLSARFRWGFTPDHLVIGVIGSAHWSHKLQWCYGRDVIEAVFRTRRPGVRGAVIVRGDGVPHLIELAGRLKVTDRVVFEEPLPGYEVFGQIRAFDIGLSTQTNDEVGRCRTTGKLVQYLAAGIYVLASRVGEAARILPLEMTVPYDGEWDEGYFSRLARRIESLPFRGDLAQTAGRISQTLRENYEYGNLRQTFGAAVRP
jgi:glycosyltransferase involved in cell wall biosynthesis